MLRFVKDTPEVVDRLFRFACICTCRGFVDVFRELPSLHANESESIDCVKVARTTAGILWLCSITFPRCLEEIDIDGKLKQDFEAKINIDEEIVMDQLRNLPPEFSTEIYNAACVASVVDGKLKDNELKFLQKLAEVCNCEFDKRSITKLANELHS